MKGEIGQGLALRDLLPNARKKGALGSKPLAYDSVGRLFPRQEFAVSQVRLFRCIAYAAFATYCFNAEC